jgi:hypothetical protein
VVDAAGSWGFGLLCFGEGGCCPLSAVVTAPFDVVGVSGIEYVPGGRGYSSSSMSVRVFRSYSGSGTGGNLSTSLIVPITHLVRSRIVEWNESWCFMEHRGYGVARNTKSVLGPRLVLARVPMEILSDKSSRPVCRSASHMRVILCLMVAATRPAGW